MDIQSVSRFLFGLLVSTYLWEHVGRTYSLWFRPTTGINFFNTMVISVVAAKVISFFTEVGKWIAFVSSYFERLNFAGLLDTFNDLAESVMSLGKSFLEIVMGPFYICHGYISEANLYDHPYLILLGTFLLGVVAFTGYTMYMRPDKINVVATVFSEQEQDKQQDKQQQKPKPKTKRME